MKKTLAIIAIVMLASLSVVGCTSNSDYSNYYTSGWQGGGFIVTQPFTKSTNVRGNDIYLGIFKNATLPNAPPYDGH